MMAPYKWIILSPTSCSTLVKCSIIFTSVNLKHTTKVEIPERWSMHASLHTLNWKNIAFFPNFNYKAFQSTLDNINDFITITIHYIIRVVKLKKHRAKENPIKTRELGISKTMKLSCSPKHHFLFYSLFLISFLFNFALYYKIICQQTNEKHHPFCYPWNCSWNCQEDSHNPTPFVPLWQQYNCTKCFTPKVLF
jgi:hypothetical protein